MTEAAGHRWIVVVLLGTVSGAAGGVMRDVLSGVDGLAIAVVHTRPLSPLLVFRCFVEMLR
jgi:uncharacterized membrane protein YeiH